MSIQTCELYCSIVALPGIFLVLFVVPIGTVSVGQSIVCKINLEETERPMSSVLSSKYMTFTIKSEETGKLQTSEMVQWVKTLAPKSKYPSSVSGSHRVEGQN